MTRALTSFDAISQAYDALYVDLWGCLHNGVKPFGPAVSALQNYKKQGGVVVLVTNSPRPKPFVVSQLEQIGVPKNTYDEIASSGDAAQMALAAGVVGRKVYHIGPARDAGFFRTETGPIDVTLVPLNEAEGIVCTGLFDDQTEIPDDYRLTILDAKNRGLKMLCANPDIVVDQGDKRIYCAGAIAAAYSAAGGTSLYFGKPHPPIYDLAHKRLTTLTGRAIDPAKILCIGDGITTDIQGGIAEGLDTLFITGGLAATEISAKNGVSNTDEMSIFLKRHQLSPTYAMPHLR
ncbi:MAG: TIGR01459 family HAD-type hydrolase [Paracoccaceae bacterium]